MQINYLISVTGLDEWIAYKTHSLAPNSLVTINSTIPPILTEILFITWVGRRVKNNVRGINWSCFLSSFFVPFWVFTTRWTRLRNGGILLILHIYIFSNFSGLSSPMLPGFDVGKIHIWRPFIFWCHLYFLWFIILSSAWDLHSARWHPRIPHYSTQVAFPLKVELCFLKIAYFAIILTEDKIWVPEMLNILAEITLEGNFSWISRSHTLCTFQSFTFCSLIWKKGQVREML